MKKQLRAMLPLILLFLGFNNFFLLCRKWLSGYGLDSNVLIIANSLFFVVSVLVYKMQRRGVQNANPNVFVRSVMGGTLLKMAVVIIAVAVYAFAFRNSFSKMSVFAAMILYLLYLAVEVSMAMKLNKPKNG